jgi:hypothetical protein
VFTVLNGFKHLALWPCPHVSGPLVDGGHLLHMWVDHVESKSEVQAEQVQWVFGGPQASSCEDANIVVIKVSPGAFHQSPYLLYLKPYL